MTDKIRDTNGLSHSNARLRKINSLQFINIFQPRFLSIFIIFPLSHTQTPVNLFILARRFQDGIEIYISVDSKDKCFAISNLQIYVVPTR